MPEPVDIRASFLRFPAWTQHFWTWLTGKALPDQTPLFRHTWYSYLASTLAAFFAGLALSSLALVHRFALWPVALSAGWILTIAGARTMILVIAHQCIHKQFSGSAKIDRFCGELVTVLTVFQDAHEFKVEHFDAHHRESIFGTLADPPAQVLLRLGFQPGMSRRQLWRRAALVFVSPRFYLQGFGSRLKCNLLSGTWRRAGFVAWAGFWLSLPFWLQSGGLVLALAFAVPVIPVCQLSALLDKLGEHAWLTAPDPRHGRKHYHVSATWARFCGRSVPPASLPWYEAPGAWVRWLLAMTLYHLPSRLLVIVGDLPNHDHHHRHPATPDWMISAYARQRDIDSGRDDAPPYTEVWGMARAIDRMFERMSVLPGARAEKDPSLPMQRHAAGL